MTRSRGAEAETHRSAVERRSLTGWGRTSPSVARVRRPTGLDELRAELGAATGRGVIARGLGRSYGDPAQNGGGTVLDLTGFDEIADLDAAAGVVSCGAGCSVAALLRYALPRGWFLPVVPGTQQVTLGGAVAADVHGKNHHRDGSLGDHVASLSLLDGEGELRELDPERAPEEFAATVGGLGLTGVIVAVRVRLLRVESAMMRVTTERADGLDELLARLSATDHLYRYSVAWIDCARDGAGFGRGVLMRGDHASADEAAGTTGEAPLGRARPRAPAFVSFAPAIRNATTEAFNELYFRRARVEAAALQTPARFFFPLDQVGDWNRAYGRAGFLQYQFVLPFGSEDALRETLALLSGGSRRPTLVVLKRFGSARGLLSFPSPGWTVACDLPLPAPGLAPRLDRADEIVAEHGGRVYLAKDSRMRPEPLAAMYPELGRWREIRARLDTERRMQSDLARRLALTADAGGRS